MNSAITLIAAYACGAFTGALAVIAVALWIYIRHYGNDWPDPVGREPDEPVKPRSGVRMTESNGTHKKPVSYLERADG